MGVCEKLVYFESRFGKQRTQAQRVAAERGDAAHAQFYQDAVRAGVDQGEKKPWCFIASFLTAIRALFKWMRNYAKSDCRHEARPLDPHE
jgi:hypothetical protein